MAGGQREQVSLSAIDKARPSARSRAVPGPPPDGAGDAAALRRHEPPRLCPRTAGQTSRLPRTGNPKTGREDAARLALEQQITRLELFVLDVLPEDARQGRTPRRRARLALGTALQVALFVYLPRVSPPLPTTKAAV